MGGVEQALSELAGVLDVTKSASFEIHSTWDSEEGSSGEKRRRGWLLRGVATLHTRRTP